MELFIVLGGLLTLPIIKYINQPVKPPECLKTPENLEKSEENEEKSQKISEEALKSRQTHLEDQIKKAQIRREKILSPLTDHEKELFLDYIEGLKNPKPQKSYESCLACVGIFTLIAVLTLAAYTLITAQISKKSPDL